ncbi:MAG: hypothetical protein V7K55_24775 [Nostoc sp.]|uniref:hypothetical protein n=1 Tax=Nostoc sp. TaxID=1180 RepID=UPI002FFA7A06
MGASLTPNKIELFDRFLAALLQKNYHTSMLPVRHREWEGDRFPRCRYRKSTTVVVTPEVLSCA